MNGVVPENQLPFSIQTSEIIAIGDITSTTDSVNLAVHISGSNKVRVKGKIYEREFPNVFNYTAVVNYIKILVLYALPEPALFFLAEGIEAEEAVEPELPEGAVPIRRIIVNVGSQHIEDYSDLFKSIDDRLNDLKVNLDNEETERLDQMAQEIENREASESNLLYQINTEIVNRAMQDSVLSALKLDKPTAPNNTSDFLVTGNNSIVAKSNFQRNKQFFVPLPATVLEDWKGCIVIFTSTGILTVPTGLTSDFTCNGKVDEGVTVTPAITSPMAWFGSTPTAFTGKAIFLLSRRDGSNYFEIDGL
ncbi:hypothetical protein [Halpernia humi]|uniref:hypothetical protein n=1 Tax=Halpernia humi TaxID=493375 RepID=UPI0011B073B9|nr:hypothetical protein [Halpernia humi]